MRRLAITSLLLLVAAAVYASGSFDNRTGYGFVSKGDVMTSLGYQGNSNIPSPVFRFTDYARYRQSCIREAVHADVENEVPRIRTISLNVAYETRVAKGNQNVVGYNLLGFTAPIGAEMPETLCRAEDGWVPDADGAYPSPHLMEERGGNLTVSDGTRIATIWPARVPWGFCGGACR